MNEQYYDISPEHAHDLNFASKHGYYAMAIAAFQHLDMAVKQLRAHGIHCGMVEYITIDGIPCNRRNILELTKVTKEMGKKDENEDKQA